MNILIFTRKFDGVVGGVEKMVLTLAEQMQLRGHSVTVASLDGVKAESFYSWPSGIDWVRINIGNPDERASLRIRISRIRAINRVLREKNIESAVGFQIGSFALLRLAAIGLHINCVAAERNAPSLFTFIRHGRIKRFVSNLILCFATLISIQLEEHRKYYPRVFSKKIHITNNPVLLPRNHRNVSHQNTSDKIILYVGRITFQKNLEILVEAVSRLKSDPLIQIVGGGESLPSINELANKLGVRIEVHDFSNNLEAFFLNADVFCLPSRWEGFPNVVGEALAYGLPVVGFEECAGISSLIQTGISGVIASGNDNAESLSQALENALNFDWNPSIIRNTMEKFSLAHFADSWESTFFSGGPHE